jgi:RNA-directed DNA polymerase
LSHQAQGVHNDASVLDTSVFQTINDNTPDLHRPVCCGNTEKPTLVGPTLQSRMIDLKTGESFTFLGFEYRPILSLRRKWRPHYAPKLKKRTALFEKLREIFRQHVSWPVERVIEKINPLLRGWVNYFRVGHSSRCFGVVKRWVEKKVRQHLMRARGRKGFGWGRWSSEWLYDRLGLFNDYRLRRWSVVKAAPAQ